MIETGRDVRRVARERILEENEFEMLEDEHQQENQIVAYVVDQLLATADRRTISKLIRQAKGKYIPVEVADATE